MSALPVQSPYDGQYLWPPRPEGKIPPAMMGFYERRGWHAQVKKNGTCTFAAARAGQVVFMTRHATDHELWKPLDAHREFLSGPAKWEVFICELLHSKTPHIKNHLYIFDMVVADGVELVGSTFDERQKLLAQRFPGGAARPLGYRFLNEHFSVAATYLGGFAGLWSQLAAEDEGLVFKDPKAKLEPCIHRFANSGWQVKCRKPTKNAPF